MVLSVYRKGQFRESRRTPEFSCSNWNQYYIKQQLDFSQVMAWMHRVKQSVVKRLDHLFDDDAVLIYQINPN